MCYYAFYGDGSNLSGLPGFSPDSQQNLYAGTGAGAASDADTCYNIALGCNAGNALNAGDYNVFLGRDAGYCTTSGGCNFVVGNNAGRCRNAADNIFIGKYTGMGCNGADGGCNIALGPHAGQCGTTGDKNIFLGFNTGKNSTTGCYNIFFGTDNVAFAILLLIVMLLQVFLLQGVVIAISGIFIGESAGMGCNGATGAGNIMLGQEAGKCSTTGANNVISGNCAVSNVSPQADITLYLVKVQEKL